MNLRYVKNQSNLNTIRHLAMEDRANHQSTRRNNRRNKKRERIKNKNYQRTLDKFKRFMKKKGVGKTYKIKGQVLRSYWDLFD